MIARTMENLETLDAKETRFREVCKEIEQINKRAGKLLEKPVERRTAEEQEELTHLQVQVRNLETERKGLADDLGYGKGPLVGRAYQPTDGPGSQFYAIPTYGGTQPSEVRLYSHGERMAPDFATRGLPDGIQPHELHLGRLLRGTATGDWRNAQAEQRAMSVGMDGYFVPEPLAVETFDAARARSVLSQSGMRTIPMSTNTLTLARVLADPTANWVAENAAAPESAPTLGAAVLHAKKLVALIRLSRELLEDSQDGADAVRNAAIQAVALEFDRAGLFGVGAGEEPLGLFYDPGLSEVNLGANGAPLSGYSKFSEAVQKCWEANGNPTVVIYAPRTAGALDAFLDGQGQPLQPPPSFAGLRKLVSNQIPINLTHGTANNASAAFVGGFDQLILGLRTGIQVDVSNEADDAFKRSQVLIRVTVRADYVTINAGQICRIVGIIP